MLPGDNRQLPVISQIIKAIHCPHERAVAIMMEAHSRGSAVLICTYRERAEQVACVLEEIALRVSLEETE